MALNVPIRYINDGEPLNEETLNRYGLDAQTNLEALFNSVDGYDPGTVEAEANRVVLRDDQGRSKFGVPSHDQHPWRVAEYLEFREFLLDNADYIRLERLRKASTTQQGIVQLVDSYTDTSLVKAPTADALRRAFEDLEGQIQTVADNQVELTTFVTFDPAESRNNVATTPKAVYDAAMRWMAWFKDPNNEGIIPGDLSAFSDGTWGWKKIPGGLGSDWIMQTGTASTGVGGKRTIYLPEAYSMDYAVLLVEAGSGGWNGAVSAPEAEPTIYAYDDGEKTKSYFTVSGVRIHNDGIGRYGEGMTFAWFTFGY